MKEELKTLLYEYLGGLRYVQEHECDWILKDRLSEKINACNVLLGINEHEKTWYEKIAQELKK